MRYVPASVKMISSEVKTETAQFPGTSSIKMASSKLVACTGFCCGDCSKVSTPAPVHSRLRKKGPLPPPPPPEEPPPEPPPPPPPPPPAAKTTGSKTAIKSMERITGRVIVSPKIQKSGMLFKNFGKELPAERYIKQKEILQNREIYSNKEVYL